MRCRLTIAAALTLALAASAQTALPLSIGARPGNAAAVVEPIPGVPAGTATMLRMAGIYDAVPAQTIHSIAMRPRWAQNGQPAFRPVDIRISVTSTDLPAWSHTSVPMATQSTGPAAWPAMPPAWSARDAVAYSEPFAYLVPLPTPYAHPGGTLVVSIEVDVMPGHGRVELDAFEDGRLYTPMRQVDAGDGCWHLADTWGPALSSRVGPDVAHITIWPVLPPAQIAALGEADWICTGLPLRSPLAGCFVEQDLGLAVSATGYARLPYWPGLHRYPVTLVSQRIRMAGAAPIAVGRPTYWSLARHSFLEDGDPDFHGRLPQSQMHAHTARAPALDIR